MSIDIRLLRRNGLENVAASIVDTPHDVLFDDELIKRSTLAELDLAREWLADRILRVIEHMDKERERHSKEGKDAVDRTGRT